MNKDNNITSVIMQMLQKLKKNLSYFIRGNLSPVSIIFIDENGQERYIKYKNISFLKISGTGKNNIIKIEEPISDGLHIEISYNNSNNNQIMIHKNITGDWSIGCWDQNNKVEIGEGCACCSVCIALIENEIIIGKNCMLSNNIHIWGDGHSVLDVKTGKVLNKPKSPIVIGDHCWIGERVTLTKSAQIPNDCIVGIASVVTKKFTEEHCVLAGCPAKVVKTGVSWHGYSPCTYEEKIKKYPKDTVEYVYTCPFKLLGINIGSKIKRGNRRKIKLFGIKFSYKKCKKNFLIDEVVIKGNDYLKEKKIGRIKKNKGF